MFRGAEVLVVAALGGNALLKRGEDPSPAIQRKNVRLAAAALAEIVHAGHRLVVTHGNGPQVGLLALRQIAAQAGSVEPLDLLDAQTEGLIGYMIEQELENALGNRVPVATLLTQVEVDPKDPGFRKPSKFIGPGFTETDARDLADRFGWAVARDGKRWRRVVASPRPSAVPDLGLVRLLVDHGAIVVCAGGGGIPVTVQADGTRAGIEAVVDKDRVSALIAAELGAEALLLLTDVPSVFSDWPDPARAAIGHVRVEEAERLDLPDGSMGPKVEAACAFASAGTGFAGIGALEDAAAILARTRGTIISRDGPG